MKTDNELIAEFMGMRYQVQVGPFGGEYPYIQSPITKEWYSPKWDKSWSWIMSVVEKINSDLGTINIDSDSVFVHSETELLTHIYNTEAGGKIGAVYDAVVFFIKWYNENKS